MNKHRDYMKQINICQKLHQRIKEIADRNRRSITAQVEVMLESSCTVEEKARKYEGQ